MDILKTSFYGFIVFYNQRMKFMRSSSNASNFSREVRWWKPLVMSKSDFIKLEFLFPEYKEQTAIAQVLQAADKEISLLRKRKSRRRGKREVEGAKEKRLMQQLLTFGKVRL